MHCSAYLARDKTRTSPSMISDGQRFLELYFMNLSKFLLFACLSLPLIVFLILSLNQTNKCVTSPCEFLSGARFNKPIKTEQWRCSKSSLQLVPITISKFVNHANLSRITTMLRGYEYDVNTNLTKKIKEIELINHKAITLFVVQFPFVLTILDLQLQPRILIAIQLLPDSLHNLIFPGNSGFPSFNILDYFIII